MKKQDSKKNKRGVLLATTLSVATVGAVIGCIIAATRCSDYTEPHIEAHSTSALIAGVESEATIEVEAFGVNLPVEGTVVQQEGLPTDIAAIWQTNGQIQLLGNHDKAETIEFIISIDNVSTKTSITVAPNNPDPIIKIPHETLDESKLYFDGEYQAGVNGCFRYEYEPNPGPSEDWLVEYDIIDVNKNNYVYGNFIRFEYIRESAIDYDMVIYGLSQEEFEVGKEEIVQLLSDTKIDLSDSVWQQLLNGELVVVKGIDDIIFYLQFKILDNFFWFSNELASFIPIDPIYVYGKDLTEFSKDELKNLPIGSKFVFDMNFYLSHLQYVLHFGSRIGSRNATDEDGFMITISYLDTVTVRNTKSGNTNVQQNNGSDGGEYTYIYGSNGENWNDSNYDFVLEQMKLTDSNYKPIEQFPTDLVGLCRVYTPTDLGYFDNEVGISMTQPYLDWTNGVNAEENEIASVHINLDAYYSYFQHKTNDSPNDNYFLRYVVDENNYIDVLWNLYYFSYTNSLLYYSGAMTFKVCLPDYQELFQQGPVKWIGYITPNQYSIGGHYSFQLGAWGEPTNGTFKIFKTLNNDTTEVEQVTSPDWSGDSWTTSGISGANLSSSLDTKFITLVKQKAES